VDRPEVYRVGSLTLRRAGHAGQPPLALAIAERITIVSAWYTFRTVSGVLAVVDFEFDEQKSRANTSKHGIDFVDAQALWLDETRVEIPARTEDEPRFLVVGLIAGKHWSAVITYRHLTVRLISVRRSRREEVALYESA